MKKILFHICCGPCSTASIEQLSKEGFLPLGFYYNPNIYPKSEYAKRLKEAQKFAQDKNIQFIVPKYITSEYDVAVKGVEGNKSKRCLECWRLRLEETAKLAKELGLEDFGTSLRISPYQNQAELLALAEGLASKYDLKFYDLDMVPLYRDSVRISKDLGMYRQKYCGCKYSKDYI